MFGLVIDKVFGFFSKQWGVITGVGFGLLVLFRSIKYIEQSALDRESVRQLRDSIAKAGKARRLRDGFIKEIDHYDEDQLDRSMRDWGEFRDVQPTESSPM